MTHSGSPDRRTSTGDFASTASAKGVNVLMGARLVPAAAAATAQITDATGTVIADLAAPANGPADELHIPVRFTGTLTLFALSGASAVVDVYIA